MCHNPQYGQKLSGAQHITHLHAAIRSALDAFAAEAAALRAGGGLTAGALAALVERHRFVRAVCAFHSASENDVVFPAARCARKPDLRETARPCRCSWGSTCMPSCSFLN